ncbi:MAG: succinate dehydrogenase, hydrophobic membrane anchor protein [Alphaproteobacteria bacterium GM7ARS4]|nr:succinate dehydrogenase, hydrophobic membrane anchor protein [Alphaproteobacteria bacterium GM7ARS4]
MMTEIRKAPAVESGVVHWWYQRMTAVMLVVLSAWLAWSFFMMGSLPLDGRSMTEYMRAWVSDGVHGVLLGLLMLLIAWHGYLGGCVVIDDYVRVPWVHRAWHVGLGLVCGVCAVTSVLSVMSLVWLS